MYTLITFKDSDGKTHVISSESIKEGLLKIYPDKIENTTKYDIKEIIKVERIED